MRWVLTIYLYSYQIYNTRTHLHATIQPQWHQWRVSIGYEETSTGGADTEKCMNDVLCDMIAYTWMMNTIHILLVVQLIVHTPSPMEEVHAAHDTHRWVQVTRVKEGKEFVCNTCGNTIRPTVMPAIRSPIASYGNDNMHGVSNSHHQQHLAGLVTCRLYRGIHRMHANDWRTAFLTSLHDGGRQLPLINRSIDATTQKIAAIWRHLTWPVFFDFFLILWRYH